MTVEENKSLVEQHAEWEQSLKKAKEQTEYYKNIAEKTGRIRLREIDQLSILITERKKAEEALRESEELLRATVESTADGILVVDEKGQVTHTNKRFAQLWQIPDELIRIREDEKLLDFVLGQLKEPEVFLSKVQALYKTSDEDFDVIDFKDGRVFERFSSPLIRDGQIAGRVWSFRDITDRKRTELALRESEGKFRFLAEKMVDIVWTFDRNFQTTYVSPSIENVLGFTLEERKQQSLEEMITPESLQKVQGMFLEELQRDKQNTADPDRSIKIEVEYFRKDGSTVWMENIVKAIRDPHGALIGIHGVSRDITERKQAEEALIESESKFRNLFDLSPQAIALTELKTGRLVDINNKFCELTKYSKEEILGLSTTEVGFYPEADRSTFLKEFQASGEVNAMKMEFKAKDNSVLHALMFARIIQISGVSFIMTIFHDVTEQKLLEAQLQQAQKMEAIGRLAGGIAHDFNNILGIIIGNTELALDDVPKWNSAHSNLEEIKTASLRAKDIVRSLLSFSRKTDQELKPIKIVPITKNALKFLRSTIPTTIDIRQNILATDETILADPTQINQLLMNLCINACHAMEQKGGVIEISMESIILDEESVKSYPELNEGHYFKITVSDTGPGLDPEIIDQIFDPYFTTKEVGKGSGLGLALVHGIVKNHNGAISVTSEAGKGSTFTVFFPLAEKIPEIETNKTEELPLGNETILFVDDEKSIVNMSRRMLELLGYKVEATTSPIEALALFRSKPDQYDLIITDMTMPQMTGNNLIKKILTIRPDMPTILCTGFSEIIDEERVKEMGSCQYIEKPLDKRDFAVTIRQVLDTKRS